MDVDTYVLRNLDDQIDSYRHVLGGMKEHLDALPEEEQTGSRAGRHPATPPTRRRRRSNTATPHRQNRAHTS
jgi:hypothetical protein